MNWQEYPVQWCDRCRGMRPHSTNGKCMAMHRTTQLATVTPLKRTPPANVTKLHAPKPRRNYDQTKVRAAVAALLAGEATLQQAARDVGCDTDYLHGRAWKAAKDATSKRDDGRCQHPDCVGDGWVKDTHHRIGRGSGGSSNPLVAYYLPNLLTLCRTHHRWVTDNPNPAIALGLVIPRAVVTDPSHVPARTRDGLVMLHRDGTRQIIAPPEGGAA
jgi:hypothetical protein